MDKLPVANNERHDWFAECKGLAYMILDIANLYEQAREGLGGDSELLWSAVRNYKKWVDGPLREYVMAEQSDKNTEVQ